MSRRLEVSRWTACQHSGFAYGGKPVCRMMLEEKAITTDTELAKVKEAGGIVFDDYSAAQEYCITPPKGGRFSGMKLDGLAIYVPAPPR